MDELDLKILRVLQDQRHLAMVDLASKSASPTRRAGGG